MSDMQITFVDLKAQYQSIKPEIDAAIHDVVQNTAFIEGPYLSAFEEHFAQYIGTKHCIGVANGTDALYIALKAFDIQAGDEVITAANSYIATAEAISQTGATPVFVDCDADTYNIDVQKLEAAITERTKVIIPVHLYGQPADIETITEIARRHNLFLIEDAAQAHGATYNEQKTGTFGHCACFSFYPGKNLGAYGDGGAVVTNSDEAATFMRMYRNHGGIKKYEHKLPGINSRLDGLQAAILDVKLRYLDQWNARRREIAGLYSEALRDHVVRDHVVRDHVVIPSLLPNVESVFHLYVIRVKQREHVRRRLAEAGISTGIHYPTPIPYLEAYHSSGYTPDECPVAYGQKDEILSLPMHADLTDEQVEYVITQLKTCLD